MAAERSRGEYLLHASGCSSCHTDHDNDGPPLAGGQGLETSFGVFYPPNITPDAETGIGGWSLDDFRRSMRLGVDPDGVHLYPAFPYMSYTLIRDEDIEALWAYLASVNPVKRMNPSHELTFPFDQRYLLGLWKWWYFVPGPLSADPARDDEYNRGAYLVNALGHCGECHMPRDWFGGPIREAGLSGTAAGPEGGSVPNISPDPKTGIGRWSEDDIMWMLQSGMMPDGDFIGGSMGAVVDHSSSHLDKTDLRAIARYLLAQPPVVNDVENKDKKERDEW